MKRSLRLIVLVAFFSTLSYSQTCAGFNTGPTTGPQLQPSDTNEHQDGFHSWGKAPIYSCTYTHANGVNTNCDTLCSVSFATGLLSIEKGTLSALGTHMVSGGQNPGQSRGSNAGASCQGVIAAAAANCLTAGTSTCLPVITFNLPFVTVKTGGTVVWNSGVIPVSNTCAAVVDPENNTDPRGPPPPPPCDPPPGGDTQFGNTGGSGGGTDCEPLILDVEGHGFHLTDTANGVVFDIRADGRPLRIPWTTGGPDNAFLVLDRNGNGVIDDGSEMFSNVSPQPASTHKNGFLALAEYDKPENGGNGDGVIDAHDAIFSQLRLWIDANHDGVSQPGELHTLPELGVFSISLEFTRSHRVDEFGNEFLYKARVNQGQRGESEVGRTVYDVFFVSK
jgi:hypothetical protein